MAGDDDGGERMALTRWRSRLALALAALAGMALAGCETTGQGAATGGIIGASIGGLTCQAAGGSGGTCAAATIFGGVLGAFIGDQIEREQQKRVVYLAARSGRSARSGTFKNTAKKSVSYSAKVTKTYAKPSDPGLKCREVVVSKTVEGKAAGSQTDNPCQTRIGDKVLWPAPEA